MIYFSAGNPTPDECGFEFTFDFEYKAEWFAHPLVIKMLKEIDHVDYTPFGLKHEEGFSIMPNCIAGGTKMLINMLFKPDEIHWETACGDNCLPFILLINDIHDIKLKFSHIPVIDRWGRDFDATSDLTNEVTHTADDFSHGLLHDLVHNLKEEQGGWLFDPWYNKDPSEWALR